MKRRVLFVDDERLVVEGLQRMLRCMREEWDMEFVTSGKEALERMAAQPFDVIVSDMRMPGMNGAELMNEVVQRHPGTARLILSGHADKDLIARCVGSVHQYLAKPCDAETLKATVQRVCRLCDLVKSDAVRRLTAQTGRLPSQPALYAEMVKKLQDPEVALDEVGAVIGKDIGMTANVLKLVNSAFFGLRHEVSTPQQAVSYLGADTIKFMVLSLHLFAEHRLSEIEGYSFPALWTHSLQTAALARAIARLEQTEGKVAEEAFGSGLLHDAGKLVLAGSFRKEYAAAVRLARSDHLGLAAAETRVFGASHAEVGGFLFGLWGLPVPVAEAVAFHHAPGLPHPSPFTPLSAVHAANVLVNELTAPAEGIVRTSFEPAWLAQLEASGRLALWRQTAREVLAKEGTL